MDGSSEKAIYISEQYKPGYASLGHQTLCLLLIITISAPSVNYATAASDIYQDFDGPSIEQGEVLNSTVKINGAIKLAQGGDWRKQDSIPIPVYPGSGSSAATIGDKIVIFGGQINYDVQNTTWIYNITLDQWTQMQPAKSPPARRLAALTASPIDDQLVLFGGTGSDHVPPGENVVYNDTWIYDVSDNNWTLIDELEHPSGRCVDLITIWGTSKAIIFGGAGEYIQENQSQPHPKQCNDTWVFDFDSHRWTQIYPKNEPFRVFDFDLPMTSIPFMDKIIQYNPNVNNCTRIYDFSDNEWTIVTTKNRPLVNAAMAISSSGSNGTVLLVGRAQGTHPDNTSTYLFNIRDVDWIRPVIRNEPSGTDDNPILLPLANTNLIIYTRSHWQDMWVFDLMANTYCGEYLSPFIDARCADILSLSWNAIIPPNTSLWFKIRTAQNILDIEKETFIGPDGTTATRYETPGPLLLDPIHVRDRFIQYKARFETKSPFATSILNSVVIGCDFTPGPPVPVKPAANAWMNVSAPTFKWLFNDTDSVQGAYEWQMSNNTNDTVDPMYSEEVVSNESKYVRNQSKWFSDGLWYWRIRTMDAEGLWGPFSKYIQFGIDTIPPRSLKVSTAPAGWSSGSVEIHFEADDTPSGIDHFSLAVDGKSIGNHTSPFALTGLTDGDHVVNVRAYDKAGNYEEKTTRARIDTVPPEPFNLSVIPPGWAKADPIVEFFATDNTSGIDHYETRIDEQPFFRQESPMTLEDLSEGIHDIVVRAYDKAGNFREANTTLGFDETPPIDLLVIVSPSNWTNQDPTISFSASDDISNIDHYEVCSDNASFANESSPLILSNLTDGAHAILVRAYDLAGNHAQSLVKVLVDKTPPTGPMITSKSSNWSAHDPVLTFSSNDSMSGIEYYKKMVDNGTFTKGTSPATLLNLPDGEHNVIIRAFDLAGNYADASITVRVDRTPPGPVTLQINQGKNATSKKTVVLAISAPDNCSGPDTMCFSNDGSTYSDWEPFSPNKTWKLSSGAGDKTVHIKIRDAAGNEAKPASATISFQPPKPAASVPIAIPAGIGLVMAIMAGIVVWRRLKNGRTKNKPV